MKKSTMWNVIGYITIFMMGAFAMLPMVLAFLGYTKAATIMFVSMFVIVPILYVISEIAQYNHVAEFKKEERAS